MVPIQKLKCCLFFLFHVIFPFLFLINFIHSIHTYCFSLIYIIFFGGSKHRHTRSPLKRWRAVCAKPLKTKSKTHANIKSPLPKKEKRNQNTNERNMIYAVDIMWLCLFATTDIYRWELTDFLVEQPQNTNATILSKPVLVPMRSTSSL